MTCMRHVGNMFVWWLVVVVALAVGAAPDTGSSNFDNHRAKNGLHGSSRHYEEREYEVSPVRLAYPRDGKKTEAKWVVVGGRNVVPGSVYRVAVEALSTSQLLTIRASLLNTGEQVASDKVILHSGEISEILL
ncbi:hypothetical protein OTU49_001204, partial [Cherax quadricarinatus]